MQTLDNSNYKDKESGVELVCIVNNSNVASLIKIKN